MTKKSGQSGKKTAEESCGTPDGICNPQERTMVQNFAVGGMSKSDAWRAAYNTPDATPKHASNSFGRIFKRPHVKALYDELSNGSKQEIIERSADAVVDRKTEIWESLKALAQRAIEDGKHDVALDALKTAGTMDGCANFQEAVAEAAQPAGATINITQQSPLDAIRQGFAERKAQSAPMIDHQATAH